MWQLWATVKNLSEKLLTMELWTRDEGRVVTIVATQDGKKSTITANT